MEWDGKDIVTPVERRLYLALWRARGCVSICPDHGFMDGCASPFLDGIDHLLNYPKAEAPVAAGAPNAETRPPHPIKEKESCDSE